MTTPTRRITAIVQVELTALDLAVILTTWRRAQPADTPAPRLGQVREIAHQWVQQRLRLWQPAGAAIVEEWALTLAAAALGHAPTRPQPTPEHPHTPASPDVRPHTTTPALTNPQVNTALTSTITR